MYRLEYLGRTPVEANTFEEWPGKVTEVMNTWETRGWLVQQVIASADEGWYLLLHQDSAPGSPRPPRGRAAVPATPPRPAGYPVGPLGAHR